jgi:hypothetical protein
MQSETRAALLQRVPAKKIAPADCVCRGEGIVCESHPRRPWGEAVDGCTCGGAGMPCPVCNRLVMSLPLFLRCDACGATLAGAEDRKARASDLHAELWQEASALGWNKSGGELSAQTKHYCPNCTRQ